LRMRAGVLPTEQARGRQRHATAGGFLELAARIEHLLRELAVQTPQAAGEGLQTIARARMGIGGKAGAGQGNSKNGVAQEGSHGSRNPEDVWNGAESASLVLNGRQSTDKRRPALHFGGGGASTVRSPLCSGGLTTPAASIASISRAARL